MAATRSLCLLCRSYLLRDQASISCLPPPPRLAHTTREILQLSQSLLSPASSPENHSRNDENSDFRHQNIHNSLKQRQQYTPKSLSKEALRQLPPCRFPGEIVHIQHTDTEGKHTGSIRRLLQNRVLGFDVECSTTNNRPILVQLASRELCVLWQVTKCTPFPLTLHGILSSPHYLKVS